MGRAGAKGEKVKKKKKEKGKKKRKEKRERKGNSRIGGGVHHAQHPALGPNWFSELA